jgi:hypothetical protein
MARVGEFGSKHSLEECTVAGNNGSTELLLKLADFLLGGGAFSDIALEQPRASCGDYGQD